MKHKHFARMLSLLLSAIFLLSGTLYATAAITATHQTVGVYAAERYNNWDGVSNVTQFKGPDGCLWYAVNGDDTVTVYKTKNGAPVSGTVTLQKQHSLFGTVLCDDDGNFYLVTGETNNTDNTDVETVFISKYDKNGNLITTTGDNGSSSLAWYYDSSFYTKKPFYAGNCDAAISGNILTVNYARSMYSGHQSNSVFSVHIDDMSKADTGIFYESHSFAQRVVPTENGFVYASEGDCFDRAFCIYSVKYTGRSLIYSKEENIFDFWVEDGAYEAYDMYVVNENFAHMGGLAALPDGNIAFAAQSAQSLSDAAETESEEIFIQIFDPYKPLDTADSYITQGERAGLAGNNGRTNVTNYGVKWLTSYGNTATVSNVQIVATDKNEIVVLYELSRNGSYDGVWYITLDAQGNITRPATCFARTARLNPCEAPVFAENAVCWVGNSYGNGEQLYIYRLTGEEEDCSVTGNHTWDNGRITTAPTCQTAGEYTWSCIICLAVKTQEIEKEAHKLTKTEAKAPTCTEWGTKEYYTCSYCRKSFTAADAEEEITDIYILPGHNITKIPAKAATCTTPGNIEHYYCSVCKKTFYTSAGTWEISDVTVNATGHSFGSWKTIKEATATEEGIESCQCTKCGAEKTRTTSMLAVTYKPGDTDGDGEVSATDARLALRISVGLEDCKKGSSAYLACDADRDGSISASDARLILRAAVMLENPSDWIKTYT